MSPELRKAYEAEGCAWEVYIAAKDGPEMEQLCGVWEELYNIRNQLRILEGKSPTAQLCIVAQQINKE